MQERRARTRHLIELGGLVQKAGLVELMQDDRATLLGALLGIADQLRETGTGGTGEPGGHPAERVSPEHLKARWRRRGLRAFDADAAET